MKARLILLGVGGLGMLGVSGQPLPPVVVIPAATNQTVTVAWDAVPGCGYRVYYGRSTGQYSNTVTVETNRLTLTNAPRPIYLAAAAVASNGVSSILSPELVWPPELRAVSNVVLVLERGTNTGVWNPVLKTTQGVAGTVGWWRLRVE